MNLIDYGIAQYKLHGRGIVVDCFDNQKLKYFTADNPILNELDKEVVKDYNPETEIALTQPVNPANLRGLWSTGILKRERKGVN